uniref:Btz domain-containing protein n=1 Tax=Ascaris lumbricoides TaxID=6252 RepID=A0A9J2QAW1_ASCLU
MEGWRYLDSRVEVGSHHRRTRSRSPWRSAAPMKPTPFKRGFGERRASQRRPSPATSPIRKKPPPVNELDVASMDVKKEQKQKSGTSPGNVLSSSSHIPQNGGFRVGFGRAAAFDRFYRPLSGRELLRRAPGFAPRRLAGVRDAVDGRNSFGRNKRDEVQRSEQRRKGIEDADKPVMNLFDPCKVPTGKSYFTHDDRSSKPVRARVTRYSDGAVRQGMSDRAPVGWRNVAQVRDCGKGERYYADAISRGDSRRGGPYLGGYGRRIQATTGADGVWKHDLFDDGDATSGDEQGTSEGHEHN